MMIYYNDYQFYLFQVKNTKIHDKKYMKEKNKWKEKTKKAKKIKDKR